MNAKAGLKESPGKCKRCGISYLSCFAEDGEYNSFLTNSPRLPVLEIIVVELG